MDGTLARWASIGLALAAVLAVSPVAVAEDFPKTAPFTGIRWEGDVPHVEVKGAWAELTSIDGVPVAKIVESARRAHGEKWSKRIAEDLPEVMAGLGSPVGARVDLGLKDPSTGKSRVERGVPMTEENRKAVRRGSKPPPPKARRVDRKHDPGVPDAWKPLVRRIEGGDAAPIPAAQAAEDLDELEAHLEDRYAYVRLRGFEYRRALDAIRAALGESIPRGAFAVQLAKVLAKFGDGHTRMEESPTTLYPRGYLPFLVEATGERHVAFRPDRSGLVDAEHPFLEAIDGVDLRRWLEAARSTVAEASASFVRAHAARGLRQVAWLRQELGLPATSTVEATLADESGKTVRKTLPLADRAPAYGDWPRTTGRRLDDRTGYLRIADMDADPAFVKAVGAELDGLLGLPNLVIDVRGNGGGSRDLVVALLPRFLDAGAAPRVVNVGAYRLAPEDAPNDPEGYLANRFLYPATSSRWSAPARGAIAAFAKEFRPEWPLPTEGFSAWHYFVVEPTTQDASRYRGKVAVLLDGKCFSATDVFLTAFQGLPRVTLVGTPSGGGSARARDFALTNSRIRMQAASMASYRADGRLFDGRGIEPDVLVEPEPGYWIGKSDRVLEKARAHLAR